MCFEFCLPTNLAVVLVYWPVLHASAMEEFKDEPLRCIHYRVCHITPLLCTLINFYLTDIVMKKSHWKLLVPWLIYYNCLYFAFVKITGLVPYWFANWKDWKTPVFCALCGLLLISLYLILCYITNSIKRPN